jgi:hypothetical protein
VAVWPVGVEDVDVGELEAGEGCGGGFDEVFAGEAEVVDFVAGRREGRVVCAPVDLGELLDLVLGIAGRERGWDGRREDGCLICPGRTFVETTISFLFQPKCLIARPITFSLSPIFKSISQNSFQRSPTSTSLNPAEHHKKKAAEITENQNSPRAYPSAQSKKLIPASNAAFKHANVFSSPTCPPYVNQPPSEMAEICSPDLPTKRYSISGRFWGTVTEDIVVNWRAELGMLEG